MTRLILSTAACAILAATAGTPAKPPSPSHHCVKDGAELTGVSKKECKKQGGTWEKIGLTPPPPGDKPSGAAPGGTPAPAEHAAP